MKDKRIGRAEVIEKFGVPPEKVIEVQALIGDSSDNVPGVPGIGVKTAAQLITEYGDLDTLLKRAGEIKQDKRRQTLIDNAGKAQLSKQLVTLDQNVKLDVPIGDLAVHEPEYKRLIAFLKAMEFNTLTRRVGEFADIDIGAIEPDSSLSVGAPAPEKAEASPAGDKPKATPSTNGRAAPAPAAKGANGAPLGTPQTLAVSIAEAARNGKFDRSKYETVRSLDRLKYWIARASDLGVVALDTETNSLDPMVAELCGFSLSVGPNEACYVPLSHKHGGDVAGAGLFATGLEPDQITERDALKLIKPLLEDRGVLKIAQNLKFDLQIFALRGIDVTPCDDTMLMSYVLDAGRSDHGLDPLSRRFFDHHDHSIRGRSGFR